MKHLATFSSLLGALCLAAPVTGWSKDKDHDHHHDRSHDSHHHDRSHDWHNHGFYGPSVYYRSYRPYPYYGSGYYSPYSYYSRPSVSIVTGPSYGGYRSDDYDDDLAVDVQRALARRGYYRGTIDGDVGPGTRSAIREYQYQHRLEVTGRIDRSLLRSLGLS